MKSAAEAEGVTAQTIRVWARAAEFSSLYARAREAQAHALAEEAVEIADGQCALVVLYEAAIEEQEVRLRGDKHSRQILQSLRPTVVNRDRMRMDARKWLSSKIAPNVCAEKLELGGDDQGPVVVRFVHD